LSDRKFVLIRHSAVSIDSDLPAAQWRLSANGRFLSHQLTDQLRPYRPTRFITSDEAKAVETGQIMAAQLDLPCTIEADLHEHNRAGLPFFEDKVAWATAVSHFFAHPDQPILGEETAVQARQRLEQAIARLQHQYPHDTLALVSHGRILTTFISWYNTAVDPFSFWQSLTLPCAFILDSTSYQLQQRIYIREQP
jgi:2,3-bisphosphoglycerate-dependent phosphoglycerate mutase